MWLEALGTALGVAGTIYGSAKSSQKNKEAQAVSQRQKADNERWWNVKRSENNINKAYNQEILSRMEKQSVDRLKQINATNAVAGGTNERFAVAQEAEANAKANVMSDMAADGARRLDAQENAYRAQKNALENEEKVVLRNEAENVAQAASQTLNAGMNLIKAGQYTKKEGK